MRACWAPSLQLHLAPTGDVRVCCQSLVSLGNVSERSLTDIWRGAGRRAIEAAVAGDDFSVGCENCEAQILLEGRAASPPAEFDRWVDVIGRPPDDPQWPRRMEFELSNRCNLQCVQCNGDQSSSIRIHRERRPPLPSPYDDAFFADLRGFLPHLRHASFAGGEPFLSPETFRVWRDLAQVNPALRCTVLTNATQWGPRVRRALDSLRFDVVFSIDGATAATYEEIRVGADFEAVMSNMDRFLDYTRRIGTDASINFCLMPRNAHELPDVLLLAEERGIVVNVMVVRSPVEQSISRLSDAELVDLRDRLGLRSEEMERSLDLNLPMWRTELARLAAWTRLDVDQRNRERARTGRTILAFRQAGDGPSDDRAARAELRAWATDGSVHAMEVGSDDVIGACDEGMGRVLGIPAGDLVGRNPQFLLGVIEGAVLERPSVSRQDLSGRIGGDEVRLVAVARRGDDGWADRVTVLAAVRHR